MLNESLRFGLGWLVVVDETRILGVKKCKNTEKYRNVNAVSFLHSVIPVVVTHAHPIDALLEKPIIIATLLAL